MTPFLSTQRDLFDLLLTRMRRTGVAVAYPHLFTVYFDQLVENLSHFPSGTDRLFPSPAGSRCPCCGIEAGAAVLAALTSAPEGSRVGTCNRLFAALAIDLLAKMPLGLSLVEANTAMIGILGLDRDGLLEVVVDRGVMRWETSKLGETQLGACVRVPRLHP